MMVLRTAGELCEATPQTLDVNEIRMRVATQGNVPLVLLCHGFPEHWCSWRHQMKALADAGWRVAGPDRRGYGGTDVPADPQSSTMVHYVADMVDLVKALGEHETISAGHDWGAPAAWHAALLRPDIFCAVAGLSVPYSPPFGMDLLTALERQGVSMFYMQYFQTPRVSEAELEADVEATIRRVIFSMSGDGPGYIVAGIFPPGAGFLDVTVEPKSLPDWLSSEDISYVASEFRQTGFHGGLNWYRAMRQSTELLATWTGAVIHQLSLFIAGMRDDVKRFPGAEARIKKLPEVLLNMRGCHLLEGAGHWI